MERVSSIALLSILLAMAGCSFAKDYKSVYLNVSYDPGIVSPFVIFLNGEPLPVNDTRVSSLNISYWIGSGDNNLNVVFYDGSVDNRIEIKVSIRNHSDLIEEIVLFDGIAGGDAMSFNFEVESFPFPPAVHGISSDIPQYEKEWLLDEARSYVDSLVEYYIENPIELLDLKIIDYESGKLRRRGEEERLLMGEVIENDRRIVTRADLDNQALVKTLIGDRTIVIVARRTSRLIHIDHPHEERVDGIPRIVVSVRYFLVTIKDGVWSVLHSG